MLAQIKQKQDTPLRLTSPVTSVRFDAAKDSDAESKLVALLERNHKNTSNILLTRPEEVFFDSNGKMQARFTASNIALASLCSRLLPGLAQTVANLAGSSLTDDELLVSTMHDPQLAVKWVNDAIRLRFEKIKGYSLIVDTATRRVEGLVGRKYAFLPNLDLYRRAKTFVSAAKRKASFSEAAVSGRRLMLRFKENEPLFITDDIREPFYSGFHFSNSETGDCSIKASAVLQRQQGNTKAISDFADGSKIAHVRGAAFQTRLSELLTRVAFKSQEIQKYKNAINKLLVGIKLGLGNNQESHDKRVKAIISQLQRQGLSSEFAQAVIRHLLYYGSYKHEQLDHADNPMTRYATRTVFDLYNALSYRAKTEDIAGQELAEQVAFKLLTGKFSLH